MPETVEIVVDAPAATVDDAAIIDAAQAAASAEVAAQAADAAIGAAHVAAAVAEAEAAAATVEAVIEIEQNELRLARCETETAELRGMVSGLMTALETTQATLAALLTPPASELSFEPTPEELAAAEAPAATVVPSESVADASPAAQMRRARRRLI